MKHDMEFILANGNLPFGRITSTARRGRKWFDLATAGDRLRFRFTETGEIFGRAAVVKVELVTLMDVIDRASENHAAEGDGDAVSLLQAALVGAYGKLDVTEPFTMVHFIRLNSDGRDAAYDAIDSERDYQDALRGVSGKASPRDNRVKAFILYMGEYLDRARRIAATDWSPACDDKCLIQIRKVASLGVAIMESHGAPLQKMPDAETLEARVSSIR